VITTPERGPDKVEDNINHHQVQYQ
jgi:hypothetical protein